MFKTPLTHRDTIVTFIPKPTSPKEIAKDITEPMVWNYDFEEAPTENLMHKLAHMVAPEFMERTGQLLYNSLSQLCDPVGLPNTDIGFFFTTPDPEVFLYFHTRHEIPNKPYGLTLSVATTEKVSENGDILGVTANCIVALISVLELAKQLKS